MRPDAGAAGAAGGPDPSTAGSASTRRARRLSRLAFVLCLTPGTVICMVLAPAIRSPALLLLGVVLVGAAFLVHRPLASAILALTTAPNEAGPIPKPETF
jgi:hypothetical protein